MNLIAANDLKRKLMIILEGQPYEVFDVTFASPSARGASTMVKARVRNLLSGAVLDKNFRTNEKFEEADVEKVPASFLYADTQAYYFMDEATYEQFSLPLEKIKDVKGYIKENSPLQVLKYNGVPLTLEFPVYVELKVIYAEPGVKKGDSGAGTITKLAKLETGLEVRVPPYVKEGDTVRVNTQTGEVAGRASNQGGF
jgi:elongation factor P